MAYSQILINTEINNNSTFNSIIGLYSQLPQFRNPHARNIKTRWCSGKIETKQIYFYLKW